jgi:hypothetical protein
MPLLYVFFFRCPKAAVNASCAAFGVVTVLTRSPRGPNSTLEVIAACVAELGESPRTRIKNRLQVIALSAVLRSVSYSRRKSASMRAQSPISEK